MSNVTPLKIASSSSKPLMSAGGGGTYDGTEARVAKLEAHIEHLLAGMSDVKTSMQTISDRLGDVRVDVATIKSEMSHKPTKKFIITVVLTSLAILGAISLFHEKLIHLMG